MRHTLIILFFSFVLQSVAAQSGDQVFEFLIHWVLNKRKLEGGSGCQLPTSERKWKGVPVKCYENQGPV